MYFCDESKCEAKIQKTINWVLFVLPQCMMSNTTESEWLVGMKARHIKPGRRQCHVTLERREGMVPANL